MPFHHLTLALTIAAAEPRIERDIPHADPGHERQKLDVYAPAGGRQNPVIFWIHGGGWQSGDKREADLKPQALVDAGFVFVSVNYRLLPEATIGEMAQDVARALAWTRRHARDFGGDPDQIVVTGHSAGAQLAALICTDGRYLAAHGLRLSVARGCIPVDGDTYDVPLQIATVEERRANIYRRKFGDEESRRALSPVTHVARGKGIPPFLVMHVAGHPETGGQSRRLVDALREAGVPAEVYAAEGKTHVSINADLGRPGDPPTAAMLSFIGALLRGRE
jgi:acetyl esterase/lipase